MESYQHWESKQAINEEILCLDKVNSLFNAFFGNSLKGSTFYQADTETDFNYIVDYIF